MATTTNYGWTTPDDTALVKDGAAAIRTLGSSIDTSLNTALGTRKAGMVLLNTTSFSGVSSQAITSVFSANYKNYKILFKPTSIASDGNIYMKMRSGATDNSGTYVWNGIFLSNATVNGDSNAATTGFSVLNMDAGSNANINSFQMDMLSPFESSFTQVLYTYKGSSDVGAARYGSFGGHHEVAASYDGFNLIFTGNVSGTVWVYGYNF